MLFQKLKEIPKSLLPGRAREGLRAREKTFKKTFSRNRKQITKFFNKIKIFFLHLTGYVLIIPAAYLTPKRGYVVLTTRFGELDGNLKYLFHYLNSLEGQNADFVFLTENKDVYRNLKDGGFKVWLYPNLRTGFNLLRTRVIIVDGNEWTKNLKYFLLYRSKKVQVWHGTGLKVIGLLKPAIKKLGPFRRMLKKENTFYDLLSLSSRYQVEARAKAFRYGALLINGLPRNDILFNPGLALARVNTLGCDSRTIERCLHFQKEGYKLVTYTPTWRRHNKTLEYLDLAALDELARRSGFFFMIKLHPKHECSPDLSACNQVFACDQRSDVYPLLTITDLLITDYSSIYLDYLLLDRPVIFYPYDSREYIGVERELLLDYEQTTPGPKCYSQVELERELHKHLVKGEDEYRAERKALREQFFQYTDGHSAERLWSTIKDTLLETGRPAAGPDRSQESGPQNAGEKMAAVK